ncbi:MAG: type II toxin-antitoxin system VapB family antitoxin [Solirubrobacterales bacterium]|nr:type II toxin-antitoxin system VapB family antitoxin [Solirubrobacterales bacterium]
MTGTAVKRKTSFEIDPVKVDAARKILGTRTLTETVDEALAEVVRVRQRRELVSLLFDPETSALDDPDQMAGAWR